MKLSQTPISGLFVTESLALGDARGKFSRIFCERELAAAVGARTIRQANVSSTAVVGAIRGMHYQHAPRAEMKIVRCIQGRVFDVAVDLRRGSPTFLHWHGAELSQENGMAFIIPEGCAHGFQVLEPNSSLLYFHTEFYSPEHEAGVRHDDPRVAIAWPLPPTNLSVRDASHPPLDESFQGVSL
ncbi:dTDP-4-dehydrorhamnose 3,5-epimerase [Nitrobacter hamburgensis X14]|uniref:dTDP-4-dehydrorhamnose 3,5-epimerase n=1 Tax=Nitrobacter hamburgensis (strain DSM 10229 / NCIMB 13809 / X14) TaxID=323097 RepID=Q1QJQ0_NITHX|nr:dTDP-4-dehydrorhamnose 3,5-epimerase [Nitrobacter hamburgensis]ABE63547.1 dTDP-4-dehydrorhamnose 3,5-epimerase [Nitrobacter hamburgensis X14]